MNFPFIVKEPKEFRSLSCIVMNMHESSSQVNPQLRAGSRALLEPAEALTVRWRAHQQNSGADAGPSVRAPSPHQPAPNRPREALLFLLIAAVGAALMTLAVVMLI